MNSFRIIVLGSFLMIAMVSCENDLKDVEKISSKKIAVPVDRSTGVEIIYSDSAKVKARMITPELLHFKTSNPYYEMKKGVEIIFLDANQKQNSRVTADYAIRYENERKVELKKNVVAVNEKGETFKSDELIWDENKKRFTSNKLVSITSSGNTLSGTSFWANENFSYYEITQSTGDLSLSDKAGF
ncbi:LPS export ABC transporter periplasmic protein LptC [Daejeonella oryzae]|uniref:LPS export ABC transporter periplasmic protein LptC n=1 Tax=Daejeonella oryzae TaxID=1122943 RepID=UPI00068702D7|nr:LPS export ABC transporter periplasmic protein LptC [Daejeonella oryzae]